MYPHGDGEEVLIWLVARGPMRTNDVQVQAVLRQRVAPAIGAEADTIGTIRCCLSRARERLVQALGDSPPQVSDWGLCEGNTQKEVLIIRGRVGARVSAISRQKSW